LRLNARDGAAYEANETPQKAFASRDRHSEEEEEEEKRKEGRCWGEKNKRVISSITTGMKK